MLPKTTRWRAALRAAGSVAAVITISLIGACADEPVAPPRPVAPGEPQLDRIESGGPQIDAGWRFTCGIRTDARVLCWGANDFGQTAVPNGLRAKQISASENHACAVEPDGTVTCWGARPVNSDDSWVDRGQAGVPMFLTDVVQVASAGYFTCALKGNGSITCWGDADGFGDVPPLSGVTELAAGFAHMCALKGDGTVTCWGFNVDGQATPPTTSARFTQIAAGMSHTCAVTAAGTVMCWGRSTEGQTDVPVTLGAVSQIAVGMHTSCALETDGHVVCWGENNAGQATPPSNLGSVIQLTVSGRHACALKADLSAVCWGSNVWQEGRVPSLVNRAPTVSFGSPGEWWEGTWITIPALVTDPDGDVLTYRWTANGFSIPQSPPSPTLEVMFLGDGLFDVVLTVSDGSSSATATLGVPILNATPRLAYVTTPTAPVAAGTAVTVAGSFTDLGRIDTHTATIRWGATSTPAPATVNETTGSGTFTATRTDLPAGVYQLSARVADNAGAAADTTVADFLVVYDPSAGYVTGKGSIQSPAGACQLTCYGAEGRASFGFTSRYEAGSTIPTGSTQFVFKAGNLEFASTKYQWLVVSGARAQYKGDGTINGGGSYGFLLTAVDGDLPGGTGTDKFRIKIWDKASGLVVYDNQMGTADSTEPTSAIASGAITIKK